MFINALDHIKSHHSSIQKLSLYGNLCTEDIAHLSESLTDLDIKQEYSQSKLRNQQICFSNLNYIEFNLRHLTQLTSLQRLTIRCYDVQKQFKCI
jgi:hypothetical protein